MSIRIEGGHQVYQGFTPATVKKTATVEENQNADKPKNEVLEEMLKELQEVRKTHTTQLKFEYHEGLRDYFMSIVDSVTQEVLKEIPPKKLLDLYAAIQKNIGLDTGLIVDKKA